MTARGTELVDEDQQPALRILRRAIRESPELRRGLGVTVVFALLSALAQEGFQQCLAAVRIASEAAGPDPVARYRALGRAYVQFARDNPSFFRAITHPEVESHADEDLLKARAVWMETLRDGIGAAQAAGWQADIEVNTLLAFSCGAPLGMAQMVSDPHWNLVFDDVDALADAVFDLVVHRSRFTAVSSGNKRRKAS